jgi:hypothetical protein
MSVTPIEVDFLIALTNRDGHWVACPVFKPAQEKV